MIFNLNQVENGKSKDKQRYKCKGCRKSFIPETNTPIYYSKEDIYEDRAEIFSYLLATASDEELPKVYDSEHIQDKVELLVSEIESHFRTVDERAYWNRWY